MCTYISIHTQGSGFSSHGGLVKDARTIHAWRLAVHCDPSILERRDRRSAFTTRHHTRRLPSTASIPVMPRALGFGSFIADS